MAFSPRRNDARPPGGTAQSGVALLLLLVFVAMAASAFLVERLEGVAERTRNGQERQTLARLAQARAALIAYAATYPDNINPDFGPGFLPCPDTSDSGNPNPPCGPGALGRLPWRELGLSDLRDASGERLWYAVSDNFRNNPKVAPMNSDTPGQLTLDGVDGVVAVIMAPGPVVGGQDRAADPADPANYLEDDNAAPADGRFVSRAVGEFNDRVAAVSHAHLMAAVERRVLGEATVAVRTYMAENDDTYPWLSPFDEPWFQSRPDALPAREGRLAFNAAGHRYSTALEADWALTGADISVWGTVSQGDVAEGTVNVSPAYPAQFLGGACTWRGDPERVACVARARHGANDRIHAFTYTGVLVGLSDWGTDQVRRARVHVDDLSALAGETVIRVVDIDPVSRTRVGGGVATVDADTTGWIHLGEIKRDLAVPEELALPGWFVENEWHRFVYVALSAAHVPGVAAATCMPGVDCITLRRGGTRDEDDKRALLVIAGPALASQSRPAGDPVEYFEGENATGGDDRFETRRPGAGFNDQLRVAAP